MDYLRLFYGQEVMREAVKQYMYEVLDTASLRAVYHGDPVTGYCEARRIVETLFSNLSEQYAKKDSKKEGNQAR